MPIDRPSVFIVLHEDGTHTNLTRDKVPDDVHAARVEKVLASQSRRGFLVKLEGNVRLNPQITNIRTMNSPGVDFETVKASFIRRNGGGGVARRG